MIIPHSTTETGAPERGGPGTGPRRKKHHGAASRGSERALGPNEMVTCLGVVTDHGVRDPSEVHSKLASVVAQEWEAFLRWHSDEGAKSAG